MNLAKELARHFREAYVGENWSEVSLQDLLENVSLKTATAKVHNFNSIAEIVYHINYYVVEMTKVLEGLPLEAKDEKSFDLPVLNSEEDWSQWISKTLQDGIKFTSLLEKINDTELWSPLDKRDYGSIYKNFQGILEHFYYHLGQITLIKKILEEE